MRRRLLAIDPLIGCVLAVALPIALTAVLLQLKGAATRDQAFVYLTVVVGLGLVSGLVPALVAAAASFLLVDYYFVPPVHTFTIADETDVVNLVIFVAAALVVGELASRRRRALLEANALSDRLRGANEELHRLYREQEASARTAVRLAQTQQQVAVLEQADTVRRELLQNVSHELRTPLASILTGSTSLLARADIPAAARADLEAIVAESRRLDRLVGDMLDLARIEGHGLDLHIEPVDIVEAAQAAATRLQRVRPERRVVVDAPAAGIDVEADWDRLAQIFDNLLANADRYAPPGTPLEVRVTPGARDVVVTRVVDHGPGVPEALRAHVFERFVRDEADGSGTGLGLAIVRGLVEAHAGRVWLDDPPSDGGAVFAFALPAAPD